MEGGGAPLRVVSSVEEDGKDGGIHSSVVSAAAEVVVSIPVVMDVIGKVVVDVFVV